MSDRSIAGARVLILATNGFEYEELVGPRARLLDAGAEVTLASIDRDPIQGTEHDVPKGDKLTPDATLDEVEADGFDALLLPGGVANPDQLRTEDRVVALVRAFDKAKKPLAAICHGPWLLAEADVLRGRTVTSWPSIRTDLRNAGAEVVDREAQVDGHLITSRNPDDVPAFSDALIQTIAAARG